jgi:integrase
LATPSLWGDKPERAKDVARKIHTLVGWLGDVPIHYINYAWLNSAVVRLRAEGRSGPTINRYLTALRPLLTYALDCEYIPKLPKMPWQAENEGNLRWITPDEERRLLAYLRKFEFNEVADFVTVALDTGCRRGELLVAQPSQVQGPWLHLKARNTKGDADRSVPLTPRALAILQQRLPWRIGISQLNYGWRLARKFMGLSEDPDFTLHVCRHTCATRLVDAGVNLRTIQEYLGYADIAMTVRYAKVSPKTLADAAKALAALGGGQEVGDEVADSSISRPSPQSRCGRTVAVKIPQKTKST